MIVKHHGIANWLYNAKFVLGLLELAFITPNTNQPLWSSSVFVQYFLYFALFMCGSNGLQKTKITFRPWNKIHFKIVNLKESIPNIWFPSITRLIIAMIWGWEIVRGKPKYKILIKINNSIKNKIIFKFFTLSGNTDESILYHNWHLNNAVFIKESSSSDFFHHSQVLRYNK